MSGDSSSPSPLSGPLDDTINLPSSPSLEDKALPDSQSTRSSIGASVGPHPEGTDSGDTDLGTDVERDGSDKIRSDSSREDERSPTLVRIYPCSFLEFFS